MDWVTRDYIRTAPLKGSPFLYICSLWLRHIFSTGAALDDVGCICHNLVAYTAGHRPDSIPPGIQGVRQACCAYRHTLIWEIRLQISITERKLRYMCDFAF